MKPLYIVAKQFVQEQENELMKEWVENPSEKENVMLAHDVIPIQKVNRYNNLTSYISKGAFSQVYEALYNGKRVAVKVTDSKDDVVALKRLYDLKSSLPEEYRKFITNIYSSFKEGDFYYVVVEYLYPVNEHIKRNFFRNEDYEAVRHSVIENKELIRKIIRMAVERNRVPPEIASDLVDFIESASKEYLEQTSKFGYSEYGVRNILINSIWKQFGDVDVDIFKVENIVSDIAYYIQDLSKSDLFPREHDDHRSIQLTRMRGNRQVDELLDFLEFLKSNYNIFWADLHGQNIMQRRNGDLVISDPGLFSFDDI